MAATETRVRAPAGGATHVAGAGASVLLGPVLYLQARRTKRRTPRLDPASGPDHGTVAGAEPPLRLVVIGESTAVGVGAATHSEALPGFLAETLGKRRGQAVTWSARGKSGATARRVVSDVIPELGDTAADLVVVTVGINDLIRRRPLRAWTADLTDLIAAVRSRFPRAQLLVAGMPPVRRFPALPQPLRFALGVRAQRMDRILRRLAPTHGATYVPMDEPRVRDPRLFASDGFHPSRAGYREWAEALAEACG